MRLVLVVPGLTAQPREALLRHASLRRLAPAQHRAAPDLDSALLAALDFDVAAAPLACLGAGIDPGRRWVVRADPVTMTVTRDDVRLDARVDDLDAEQSAALADLLNHHFKEDGLEFVAARNDAWFAISERTFDVQGGSVDAAIGRGLRERLPAGADAALWRRWWTEAQMLLHEHPLAERAANPVNGLWFSQAGTLPESLPTPVRAFLGTAGRASDVASGLARVNGGRSPRPRAFREIGPFDDDAIVVLERIASNEDLDAALRRWLDEACSALDAQRLAELVVVADGHGGAARWRVLRSRWLDRWRATSFEVPATPP
jgi:hypothetical protein